MKYSSSNNLATTYSTKIETVPSGSLSSSSYTWETEFNNSYKREISEDLLEDEETIDLSKINMSISRMKGIKNEVIRCADCGEKFFFKSVYKNAMECPMCNNVIFIGHRPFIIKELLNNQKRGDD